MYSDKINHSQDYNNKTKVKAKRSGKITTSHMSNLILTSVNIDYVLHQIYSLNQVKSFKHDKKLLKKSKKLEYFNEQNQKPFAPPSDEMLIMINHCLNK